MRTKFNRAAAQSAPAAEQTTTMAMTPIPKDAATAVPMVSGPPNLCQLDGEFTPADANVPQLALGQKIGMLTEGHPDWPGQFIFDKTLNLGRELKVIPCRMSKYYLENTEPGSSEIPRRFDKREQARDANADVREVAEVDMLIEATTDAAREHAVLHHKGRSLIPARYTARGSAYRPIVGHLYKDMAGWLQGDLASSFYLLGVGKRTGYGNTWFVPKLAANGKVPAELRAKIKEILGV